MENKLQVYLWCFYWFIKESKLLYLCQNIENTMAMPRELISNQQFHKNSTNSISKNKNRNWIMISMLCSTPSGYRKRKTFHFNRLSILLVFDLFSELLSVCKSLYLYLWSKPMDYRTKQLGTEGTDKVIVNRRHV